MCAVHRPGVEDDLYRRREWANGQMGSCSYGTENVTETPMQEGEGRRVQRSAAHFMLSMRYSTESREKRRLAGHRTIYARQYDLLHLRSYNLQRIGSKWCGATVDGCLGVAYRSLKRLIHCPVPPSPLRADRSRCRAGLRYERVHPAQRYFGGGNGSCGVDNECTF